MKNLILFYISAFIFSIQLAKAQDCLIGEQQVVFEVDANGNFGAYAFSWSLVDSNSNELLSYQSGQYSDFTVTVDTLCLITGDTYTFRAFSDFGGGWNENGTSLVSIFYGSDQFPLYFDSPDNGNLEQGIPEAEFSFVAGDKLGLDCTQPKTISLYETQQLNTNAFNLNTNVTTFDSGKDIILSFIPPITDNYKFSVSGVNTPSNVSLQLLTDCIDEVPTVLGSGQSSASLEPFEFGASLAGGSTYYLLFSNNSSATGLNTAEANLEISYNGVPAADECGAISLTMDGTATMARFAEATPTGSPINFTIADGYFYQSAARDIFYDFNLNSYNVVVEIQDYKSSGELFAQLSFGGCPSGDLNLKSITFEGTTRRFDFVIDPLAVNLGEPVSLRLSEGQFDASNQAFAVKIRSRVNVEAEFPINPNNNCFLAANVTVNTIDDYNQGLYPTPVLMSNYNASDSGLPAPCGQDSIYTGLNGDVWAKAIVPASGVMEIAVEGEFVDQNSNQPLNIAWALYTGSCGSLTEYYCSNFVVPYQSDTVGGLTRGEEVYIRLFDRGGTRQGDFNISSQELEPLEMPIVGIATYIDSIQLEFNEYNFDFENYLIDVSVDSFATFLPGYQNLVLNRSTFQYNITGLLPNTKYYVRAKKVSSKKGDSEYFFDVVKTNPLIVNTIASGDWNDPSIWEGSLVPTADKGVNILHKVNVTPGAEITIEEVTIKHAFDLIGAVGLFIQDANFRVERDIDVLEEDNGYSSILDSIGVYISNSSGVAKTFSVGGSVILRADRELETQFQFFAQNLGAGLNVTIENEFRFDNLLLSFFTPLAENILLEDIEFNAQSFNILHNDDVEGPNDTFKMLVHNSIMNIDQSFTITENTSDFTSINPFYIHFTGSSVLNLGGNLNKEHAGVIKFLDSSTLSLTGDYQQAIATFDPNIIQDSTIINNLIINNTFKRDSDQANGIFQEVGVYLSANSFTGSGQLIVNGQLSLLSGVSSTTGGISNKSVELILTETASLDPAYDGSKNTYHRGVIKRFGLSDFTFPIGNDYGPRILTVSDLSSSQQNTYLKLAAFSDACGDSVFNIATGINNPRLQDFWYMETGIQEAGITADFTANFPYRMVAGIGNTSALRLLDFENAIDYGNTSSTINSFTTNYNFDNGLVKLFGIGSIDNSNTFYEAKKVASISSADVVAGENIVFTYSGNYASTNDVVYFEQIPATTISATANSITVTVPDGARSGEPVIILENNNILHVNFMVNVSETNMKAIISEQYDSLVLVNNIGLAAFGESKIHLSDINSNGEYDLIGVREGVDSIYFVKDLASSRTNSFFNFSDLEPGDKPAFKDIELSISNAFGDPTVDITSFVQFYSQQIPVYFYNDGAGNFTLNDTEGYGATSKIRSPFTRDINGDGFSDFNFTLNGLEAQYNGFYSSLFENDITCNIYGVEAYYTRGDNKTVEAVAYGNFGELQQTLSYAYIPGAEALVLSDPNDTENSFLASIGVAASLTDFHTASIQNTSKAQYLALDTVNNSIEIFDGFTTGNIQNTSVALLFSPGRMAIEDLNGDGFLDIIVSEAGTSNLYFYENNTSGSFELAASKIGTLTNIVDLEIADVSQDGNRDIVLLLENGDVYIAYFNQLIIPGAPIVLANNITTSSFDLSWLSVDGATTYAVEVSLSSDTTINLASDSIFYISDTLITFNAPIPFETYYVHARGLNAASDTSAYSTAVQVNLQSLGTPVVTLAALDANTMEITVGPVEGADSFELFITLDADTISNEATDEAIVVTEGVTSFIVPEYSEAYFVYAKSIASGIDTSLYALSGNIKLPVSPYFELDSLALVSLYNSTEGTNWANQANWLSQKVNKWYGITMIGDSIKSIDLSNNNLKNIISDSLALMSQLETFNIANNEITSLGKIATLTNQLVLADVSNNRLSFEELEVLQATPSYQYIGQQYQYPMAQDTLINLGEDITFAPESSAVANDYQWFKNGTAITAATLASLNLINVAKNDEGKYNLQITNTDFSGLILLSDTVDFKVSTLERDIAALKDLYVTANGASWTTVKWDTIQANPVDWNANATDIVVENNRIVEVNLPNNNLTGSVSPLLGEILGLHTVNFSNNKISTLPNLTRLTALISLNMDGNHLGYEDLEANVSINGFTFQNQKLIGNPMLIENEVGSSVDLQFDFGGTANTYQWLKDNEAVSAALLDSFHIDSLIYERMGSYQLVVSNSIINAKYPDFKLLSAVNEVYAIASISGAVSDANGFPTSAGKINLFKVKDEGAYDSVRFDNGTTAIALKPNGTYQIDNLRLGNYLLIARPNKNTFPNLLSTYYPSSIDWDVAEEIMIRTNQTGIDIITEGTPQALNGSTSFSGYVEVEVPQTSNSRQLPRQRLNGSGVSVRRVGNSTRSNSVFNGELVAFAETDDNGEFSFNKLPAGEYMTKVDYPGIPMDLSSDIRFTLTGENLESLKVAATIDNGVCSIKTILYTSVKGAKEISINIYPNPFEDKVMLQGDLNEINNIAIYDINGQLKIQHAAKNFLLNQAIDLSCLPPAVYLLRINWKDGNSSSSKIVKK